MDAFHEEVVTKQRRGVENFMYLLANVMMVMFGLFAMMQLSTLSYVLAEGFSTEAIVNIVLMLVMAGCAVLLFLRRDRIKTEYEYTFTNGQLDFAQVYNNKHRKSLGTMNVRNVEACGLVSSGSFNRYITMQGVKRTNWFLNREAELFYFYFTKDSQKRVIIIEPTQTLIDLIKRYIGQGVYQVN